MSHRRVASDRPNALGIYTSLPDDIALERPQWEQALIDNDSKTTTPVRSHAHYTPLLPEPDGGASLWADESPPLQHFESQTVPYDTPETLPAADAPAKRPVPSWDLTPEEAERRRRNREIASWRPPSHLRPRPLAMTGTYVQGSASGAVQYLRGLVGRAESRKKKAASEPSKQIEPIADGWSDEEEIEEGWENLADDTTKLPSERPWPGQTDDAAVAARIREQLTVGGVKIRKVVGFDETMGALVTEASHLQKAVAKTRDSTKE